ncbi:hypothetical protein [Streptomyces sp. KL116D]|uniref:hypothetical protein n=1 Tax=Streptomyces sp. KL116D TaxID=3045152 RepID=UPI003556FAAD
MRYAVDDVQIGGGTIPARGAVVAWIGSANRDASRFPDPHVRPHPRQRQAPGRVRLRAALLHRRAPWPG